MKTELNRRKGFGLAWARYPLTWRLSVHGLGFELALIIWRNGQRPEYGPALRDVGVALHRGLGAAWLLWALLWVLGKWGAL